MASGSILVANAFGRCRFRVEGQAIVAREPGNLLNDCEHARDIAGHSLACQVDVTSRTPNVEGGEKHAALQDELVRMSRDRDARDEAFECVEADDLVRRSLVVTRQPTEVEIDTTRRVVAPGLPAHRRISRVLLRTASARGSMACAISRRRAGWEPRFRNQARRASRPCSWPSRCRSRKESTIERARETDRRPGCEQGNGSKLGIVADHVRERVKTSRTPLDLPAVEHRLERSARHAQLRGASERERRRELGGSLHDR